jgi:transposase
MLRNWSYFGLKQKIEYKAKMYGITLKEEKSKDKDIKDEE